MRVRILYLLLNFLLLSRFCAARSLAVPDDFSRIGDALPSLEAGDTLIVRKGVYSPSTNGEVFPLLLRNGVSMIGENMSLCILDAEGGHRVVDCRNIRSLLTCLVNLTLRGGKEEDSRGAGIAISGNARLIIRNCRFTDNHSVLPGGAISVDGSSGISIENCLIDSNTTEMWGGGIYLYQSSPTLSNTVIASNNATRGGGVACFKTSSPVVTGCKVESNMASTLGGGIDCFDNSSPRLDECTLRYNSAFKGGGLHLQEGSESIVEDSRFFRNSAQYGGGVFSANTGATVFKRNVFEENQAGRAGESIGGGGGLYFYGASEALIDSNVIVHNRAGDEQGSLGYGGGIKCAEGAAPVITRSIIHYNIANDEGGGIWLNRKCSASIESNDIQYNTAGFPRAEPYGVGGGIFVNNGYAYVANNTISNNLAYVQAGGLFVQSAYPCDHPGKVFCQIVENSITYNTSYHDGGGIATSECDSSTYIRNTISHNLALHGGGGIQAVFNSKAHIAENLIEDNECGTAGGGAIFINRGSRPTIHGNVIRYNAAGEQPGGGIECLERTSTIITENLFLNNSGRTGGAIHARDSVYAIINRNTFIDNSSNVAGDAFLSYGIQSFFDISNNIFLEGGIGERNTIVLGSETAAMIENNIIVNKFAQEPFRIQNQRQSLVRYNCFWNEEGDTTSMVGTLYNIFADPGFIDPLVLDFNLRSDSPCIDAGNPESLPDPDSTISDIGRFHYDQRTGIDNLPDEPGMRIVSASLNQNYPNPFNPSTLISFTLEDHDLSSVDLKIYDARGHCVRELLSDNLASGVHQILWDGTDNLGARVASGIYFCRLRTHNAESSIKMILTK
jgi:hypothetical protein